MKSLANLSSLLLVGALPAAAQEPPPGDGPRGSSELAAGEVRYDAVGYAVVGASPGMTAASAALPAGSYAEITALDTGRTIVVAILGGDVQAGRVAMLSPGAATALGVSGDAQAVRVRQVTPTPQDIVQLRDGKAASFRAEAPQALLVALRKKLVPMPVATSRASRPMSVVKVTTPRPRPAQASSPTKPATSGYVVQVAALSSADRAATVARTVGGAIVAGPPLWRVRLGPYPDIAAAARAKAAAARKGYPGGQITRIP